MHAEWSTRMATALASISRRHQYKDMIRNPKMVVLMHSKRPSARQTASSSTKTVTQDLRTKRRDSFNQSSLIGSVLPRQSSETDESHTPITHRLEELQRLISDLNDRISTQQERLLQDDQEIIKQFGVALPREYMRHIGTIDPACQPSEYSCVGCGAQLHCNDPSLPGFVSASRFKISTNMQMQNTKCLRCKSLDEHDIMLNAKVSPVIYQELIAQLRHERSVILHVVDMTDFQNSSIIDLPNLIGEKHPIYVIGNKIDLIPKDSRGYLQRIKSVLTDHATQLYGKSLKHVCLASALTGYGVEELINKILSHLKSYKSNLHLIGCTNSGKSTLFNRLLMSDLCKSSARDLIGRATVSVWPGTTMNLLKFPIDRMPPWKLALRAQRLQEARLEEEHREEDRDLPLTIQSVTLRGQVDITQADDELDYRVGQQHSQYEYREAGVVDLLKENQNEKSPAFNYEKYSESKWLFDTPGLVNPNQIINCLPLLELKRLLMKQMALPRSYSLVANMTLLLGGMARIDYVVGSGPVILTVIAAMCLPVKVVNTSDASLVYQEALLRDELQVPSLATAAMLPALLGRELSVRGDGLSRSSADIQLSSTGWVAVASLNREEVKLRVYTPGGLGCHLRPPLLPHAVALRGKRIARSRAYKVLKPMR